MEEADPRLGQHRALHIPWQTSWLPEGVKSLLCCFMDGEQEAKEALLQIPEGGNIWIRVQIPPSKGDAANVRVCTRSSSAVTFHYS